MLSWLLQVAGWNQGAEYQKDIEMGNSFTFKRLKNIELSQKGHSRNDIEEAFPVHKKLVDAKLLKRIFRT